MRTLDRHQTQLRFRFHPSTILIDVVVTAHDSAISDSPVMSAESVAVDYHTNRDESRMNFNLVVNSLKGTHHAVIL
jgi:hypothetical protein